MKNIIQNLLRRYKKLKINIYLLPLPNNFIPCTHRPMPQIHALLDPQKSVRQIQALRLELNELPKGFVIVAGIF